MKKKIFSEIKLLKIFFSYLDIKKNKLKFILFSAFIFLVIGKIASTCVPLYLKDSIDALYLNSIIIPFGILFSYCISRLLSQIFSDLKDALFSYIEHNAIRLIILKIFKHLYNLSMEFHSKKKIGSLSRLIEKGSSSIERFLRFSIFVIFPAFLEVFFVSIILFWMYNIIFFLITFITLLIYIAYTITITKWRLKIIYYINKIDKKANTKAIDSLLNYENVKYFNNEMHEINRYNYWLFLYEKFAIKSKWSLAFLNFGQSLIISFGLIILISLVSNSIINKTLTVGDFILINTYLMQLYLPLGNLGFAYREIKLALVNIEEMFSLLKIPCKILDKPFNKNFNIKNGRIDFENVNFKYNEKFPILKNINFKILPKQTIAFVGMSGSGKSTISRLLFRLYDVSSGSIKIDGYDLRNINQNNIRSSIGIVPQDIILFNNTIKYNISYGKINSKQTEIENVAKISQIHDFITKLPNGYNTLVGERGIKLSGGEKQRIAIARALLKKPKIFLFDEATSSLDTNTEKKIQMKLKIKLLNHTVLIIAHRLSTVVNANNILVLEKGKIIEKGTHLELLNKRGKYTKMWHFQNRIKY